MGSKSNKIVRNFISDTEVGSILNWVDTLESKSIDPNYHLLEISKDLNGKSCIIDISKTDQTKFITNFQKVSEIITDEVPNFIRDIISRISKEIDLPTDHVFLQAVDMKQGGHITPHYDAAIDGYVNYKCNISVLSKDYDIHIDKDVLNISEKDLYCFEASLYKHWTEKFTQRRVFLSFGFIVPYEVVGRTEDDPRVRLSKRITKYFQKLS